VSKGWVDPHGQSLVFEGGQVAREHRLSRLSIGNSLNH
jgi:hypothetical protein